MSEKNMPDLGSLMGLAQKLQGDVADMQAKLAHMECQASSGGGMVTATVNGQYQLVSIKLDKEVVNPEDVDMLNDLIVAAVNQAMIKMREMAQDEMSKITGGINIPGLSGILG